MKLLKTGAKLIVALGAAIGLVVPQVTYAQTLNNSTNTLKISPVRRDVEIKPGESKKLQIVVTNLTDEAIKVHPVENDFVAGDDERGTPSIILDENKFAPSHSLKRFMAPLKDVEVPAKGSATIELTINIPRSAKAGGYFGAVRVAPVTPESGGEVNLNTSVASLILVTVPGEVTEKLELTDFNIQQGGKTGDWFGSANDLQVATRFVNKGGVQEAPIGKVSVLKDDKIVYETDFNDKNPKDVILPDSARRWEIPFSNIEGFGHYTVKATFTYGKANQTIEVTKSFWVVPMMYIIGAIVGLLLLIGLIVGIWLFLRKKRRHSPRMQGHGGLKVRR